MSLELFQISPFSLPVSVCVKEKKGYISGVNERSVLFGLYRFLEEGENKPAILAKFSDVKMSTLDDDYNLG